MTSDELDSSCTRIVEHLKTNPTPICKRDIANILSVKEYRTTIILAELIKRRLIRRIKSDTRIHFFELALSDTGDLPAVVEKKPMLGFNRVPRLGIWDL